MSSIKSYYTRQSANEGIKVDLVLPDGTETGDWLLIRGVDSDEYRAAEAEGYRIAIKSASIKDDAERKRVMEKETLNVMVSLLAGWSFTEKMTPESAAEFLTEAPQVRKMIDQTAADRSLFFEKKQKS